MRRRAWSDFHARSRFARSTIPERKWGLLVVYLLFGENYYDAIFKEKKVDQFLFFAADFAVSNGKHKNSPTAIYDISSLALFTKSLSPAKFRRIKT